MGREGDLALGIHLDDKGISRRALIVRPALDGWHLQFGNRNGAVLQLWSQAPSWINRDSERTLWWPRIAIRFVGHGRENEHWVLLEADHFALPLPGERALRESTNTRQPTIPRPLTRHQLDAVRGVFSRHLAWPPVAAPTTSSLDSVAYRLGVKAGAVKERLKAVQERAGELGMYQQYGVTTPDYVYHLGAHGYLDFVPPRIADPALG